MRTGKELIQASKEFTSERRAQSWFEVVITLVLTGLLLAATFAPIPLIAKLLCSIGTGLLYVRLFVIYHDYQHRAILQDSFFAKILLDGIGIYLLAPPTIWKRSHEHHHNNNSKLTISGIGSYPTISAARFSNLTNKERKLYLINRHPLTVIFGYLTLFVYWLNLKSFIQSPGKHLDSLFALAFHVGAGAVIWFFFGPLAFVISFLFPFFLAFGTGSYLFYAQHNFPGAKFRENHDWTYVDAAISSTSFMVMNPVLQWLTGNIGYHHVHHINSRIPFYRLKEAGRSMPELADAPTTSLSPLEMIRCFKLKLWDAEHDKMITLRQFRKARPVSKKRSIEKSIPETAKI